MHKIFVLLKILPFWAVFFLPFYFFARINKCIINQNNTCEEEPIMADKKNMINDENLTEVNGGAGKSSAEFRARRKET